MDLEYVFATCLNWSNILVRTSVIDLPRCPKSRLSRLLHILFQGRRQGRQPFYRYFFKSTEHAKSRQASDIISYIYIYIMGIQPTTLPKKKVIYQVMRAHWHALTICFWTFLGGLNWLPLGLIDVGWIPIYFSLPESCGLTFFAESVPTSVSFCDLEILEVQGDLGESEVKTVHCYLYKINRMSKCS